MNAVEAELTMYLASTARVREAVRPRLPGLLGSLDMKAYTALLDERGLLALLGSRAIELAPESADDVLRSRVQAAMRHARLRALALDTTLREVVGALEERGIPALPLKGTMLADRVHGDPGLRPTTDVDVLVPRRQVGAAVDTLGTLGYPPPTDPAWVEGLPLLHHTFGTGGRASLRVELHWRVHWSEQAFSEELLRASSPSSDGFRRAAPTHELGLLLLIFARDSLYGPRILADIATWWDRLGDRLPRGALDGIVARHRSLRRFLVAGAMCAERFVGVPAGRILTDVAADASTRRAVGLADPLLVDERSDVFATVMVIDGLLRVGRDKLGFVRRYFLQPLPHVRSLYDLDDASTAFVAARRAVHFAGAVVKHSPPMILSAARSPRRPTLRDLFPEGVPD